MASVEDDLRASVEDDLRGLNVWKDDDYWTNEDGSIGMRVWWDGSSMWEDVSSYTVKSLKLGALDELIKAKKRISSVFVKS